MLFSMYVSMFPPFLFRFINSKGMFSQLFDEHIHTFIPVYILIMFNMRVFQNISQITSISNKNL